MSVRRALLSLVVALLAILGTAHAQTTLVPAPRSSPDAMSVGCPSDWEHRDAGVGSFSCRDTETSAYCGMAARSASDALSAAHSLDEAVTTARRWLEAQGVQWLGERREGRVHVLWFELRGQRHAVIIVPDGRGYAQVNCGAGTGDLDALLPTFLAIAGTARR